MIYVKESKVSNCNTGSKSSIKKVDVSLLVVTHSLLQ